MSGTLLSVRKTARLLGVSASTVRTMIDSGQLRVVNLAGRRHPRIPIGAVRDIVLGQRPKALTARELFERAIGAQHD